jgi:hypothetical protein
LFQTQIFRTLPSSALDVSVEALVSVLVLDVSVLAEVSELCDVSLVLPQAAMEKAIAAATPRARIFLPLFLIAIPPLFPSLPCVFAEKLFSRAMRAPEI